MTWLPADSFTIDGDLPRPMESTKISPPAGALVIKIEPMPVEAVAVVGPAGVLILREKIGFGWGQFQRD